MTMTRRVAGSRKTRPESSPTSGEGSQPPFQAITTLVASTVTLAGSILGTLGVSAGVITALLRNDTLGTILAILLAAAGVFTHIVRHGRLLAGGAYRLFT